MPTLRGTTVGSVLGLLPGSGSVIGSFASYMLEKFVSNDPRKFGRGAVAGVAGPEAANNAGAQTSFIPMLSLGIPTTPVMALIVAALIINGIQTGPQLISQNSNLFWGLIASMWIGNFFLIILNLPLIGIWTAMLRISWKILYPVIVIVCFAGIYFVHSDIFNLILLAIFAIFGYILKLLDVEPAPLALGFIIGIFFEEYFKRTLLISQGDWSVFVERPISLTLLLLGMTCVIAKLLLPIFQRQKNAVF
jgi:TctA family transporter